MQSALYNIAFMVSSGPASSLPRDTLVLTATFHSPLTPTLVVRDEHTRIHQYMCALVSWAQTRRVRRLGTAGTRSAYYVSPQCFCSDY